MKNVKNAVVFIIIDIVICMLVQNVFAMLETEDMIKAVASGSINVTVVYAYEIFTLAIGTLVAVYVSSKALNMDYKDAKKMLIIVVVIFSLYQVLELYILTQEIIYNKELYSNIDTNNKDTVLNIEERLVDDETEESTTEINDSNKENGEQLLKQEDQRQKDGIVLFIGRELIYVVCIYFYGSRLYSKKENKIEKNKNT